MGLRVVPVLHCVRLALRVVLSWFGNAIDSGTGKPGAVAGLPRRAYPRRGTAHRRRSRREWLEFPKISKRNKKKTLFR